MIMKKNEFCICGNKAVRHGLCNECIYLLRAKRSKSIAIVEKFRDDYNKTHNLYKSYGQFVLLLDLIYRRKKEVDDRAKKAVVKKVRRNR